MLSGFVIGCKCAIYEVPDKYKHMYADLADAVGTIVEIHDSKSAGVSIPGLTNTRSERGLFWFDENSINILEGTNMNARKFDKDVKFTTLINPAKLGECTIGAYYGELKEGDTVVCNYGHSNGSLSVRIVATPNVSKSYATECIDCEVMGVANITDYVERLEKRERREELKKQMAERAKKYQEEEFWRHLAESDPEIAKFYKEFKELEG